MPADIGILKIQSISKISAEIHRGKDGEIYALDFARIHPPMAKQRG